MTSIKPKRSEEYLALLTQLAKSFKAPVDIANRLLEQGKKEGLSNDLIRKDIESVLAGVIKERQLRRILPLELKRKYTVDDDGNDDVQDNNNDSVIMTESDAAASSPTTTTTTTTAEIEAADSNTPLPEIARLSQEVIDRHKLMDNLIEKMEILQKATEWLSGMEEWERNQFYKHLPKGKARTLALEERCKNHITIMVKMVPKESFLDTFLQYTDEIIHLARIWDEKLYEEKLLRERESRKKDKSPGMDTFLLRVLVVATLPIFVYSTQTVLSQSQTLEVASDDLVAPVGGMTTYYTVSVPEEAVNPRLVGHYEVISGLLIDFFVADDDECPDPLNLDNCSAIYSAPSRDSNDVDVGLTPGKTYYLALHNAGFFSGERTTQVDFEVQYD